jgi:sugar O-acyltransferase (sialic acid O-acetyltransferase NeuD family)
MKKKQIILLGCSGHALVVRDCIPETHQLIGYLAPEPSELDLLDAPYLGSEDTEDLTSFSGEVSFFPAIGNNHIRKNIVTKLEAQKLSISTLQHKSSIVSPSAIIDCATLLAPGCIVNAMVRIGRGVIVNSGAIIEHECVLEDYVHIAPGATLAGNVHVGEGTFIGAGAVLREGIKVGKNCIIGAGSVVLKNVPDNQLWVGIPAKPKNQL